MHYAKIIYDTLDRNKPLFCVFTENMTNPTPDTDVSSPSLHMRLANGLDFFATAVKLYPAEEIAKATNLRSQAHQELKGLDLGIGFIGSPEFALGGALVTGIIWGLVSNTKAKRGVALLQEAAQLQDRIVSQGVLFPCEQINNIERPFPDAWSGMHADGSQQLVYGGKTPTISNSVEKEYIWLPQELGIFEVNGKEVWVRISAIATYNLVGMAGKVAKRATTGASIEAENAKANPEYAGPRILR